jgi:hypothetical protein
MADDEAAPPLSLLLAELLGDGGAGRALSVVLPAGRLVWPDPDYVLDDQAASARPAYWLSDAPAPKGLWGRLRSEHPGRVCGHCCSTVWTVSPDGPGWSARSPQRPPATSAATTRRPSCPRSGRRAPSSGTTWAAMASGTLPRSTGPGRALPLAARRPRIRASSPTTLLGSWGTARHAWAWWRWTAALTRSPSPGGTAPCQLFRHDLAVGRGRAELGGPLRGPGGPHRLRHP